MRLKLILSFVLIVLVAVGGVVLLAWRGTTTEVRAFMYRGGMTLPGGLADVLQNYYAEHGSWQGVENEISLPMHGRGQGQGGMGQGMGGPGMGAPGMGMMNQRLRLADASGQVIYDSRQAADGSLSRSERGQAIALQVDGETVGYLLPEGGMGYNRADETFLVNRLTRAALTAGLIAAGLALLLALLLAYQVMRPVREMTRVAQQLGEGDLSQRVTVSQRSEQRDDELAVLAHTFNRMAASLQQAQESRRAMTADIAHELRTPLAVQRAHLEALQDGIYPLEAENLVPVLAQNLLLTRLVDDLRTLALAEAGQLTLDRQPTDLAALARGVGGRFQAQAEPRRVGITVDAPAAASPDPYVADIDPLRIEQVLSNLLSNALRHTPDGGQIVLHLEHQDSQITLQVSDSGPGIPPEALEHVFERFYRADRSRSRDEGGSGLGLAIARQLVEAHGGCLSAANHPQGGAVFSLALPIHGAA